MIQLISATSYFLTPIIYHSILTPQLLDFAPAGDRGGRLLNYLAEVMVNGPSTPLPTPLRPPYMNVTPPPLPEGWYSDSTFEYVINTMCGVCMWNKSLR